MNQFTILFTLTKDEKDVEIVTFGGNYGDPEFLEATKCFRKVGGDFNKLIKKWYIPIESLSPLVEQINTYVGDVKLCGFNCTEFEEFQEKVNKIISEKYISELKRSTVRRLFNSENMAFPPLVGIHPFEDFQKRDIQRALNQNRFLFNWEMGLGKSYATISLIDHLRLYGCIDKSVILTTTIGTFNLKSELLKFSLVLKDEDIVVCKNTSEARKLKIKNIVGKESNYKVLITTYSVMKSLDSDFYKLESGERKTKKTKSKEGYIPFDEWSDKPLALFLDESHNLGNPKSLQSKCVDSHKQFFDYIYEFTGTFADKYEKMYQQIKLLDPKLVAGKNYNSWILEYGDIGTKFSEYAVNPLSWKLNKLNKLNDLLIANYSAKRKMDECLKLPIDYEVPTFTLEMSKSHRELYKFFIKNELEKMQEEATEQGKSLMSIVISKFAWLQSACENPLVLQNTERFHEFPDELQKLINNFNYIKDNAKVALWDEIIAERCDEEDQKGIIWCTHPVTMKILNEHYKKYNPYLITSETEDKFGEVEKFKKDKKSKLLITSIFVLNTSVTITEAKFNLYAERCFNFTIYSQSRGRIHRPGKTEVTRTYNSVFNTSTDAILDANLIQKGQMVDRLLSKDFFTDQEWKNFFSFKKGSSFI